MKWLRFLGKERQILALYDTFVEANDLGLHPTELSRHTGLDMHTIQERLDACPEIFVRLPRNPEGLVRYRLTSSASVMPDEEVRALVLRRARTEKLQVAAAVAIVISFLLIILLTVIPATTLVL